MEDITLKNVKQSHKKKEDKIETFLFFMKNTL